MSGAAKKKPALTPNVEDKAPAGKGGRVLTSLMGAKDVDTPEKRHALAKQIAADVIEAMEADRKAHGLPPLDP